MQKIVDGNEAVAKVAYYFTDVASIYPITPSTPMASTFELLKTKGKKNAFNNEVEIIKMQSEGGVAGSLHGALLSGCLATTFTSSQGLLLMLPNMYKIAGECLPCVIHVASRTIATHALSICGDHSDIYASRQTGFCMLASSSVEDAQNLAAVAHLSSIKASLPFIHFFDGFRTSHELNKIDILECEKLKPLIDEERIKKFKEHTLLNKVIRGTNQTEDIYFQSLEARNTLYDKVADVVNNYMQEINKITNKTYAPITYYGSNKAKYVIVAMGSVVNTIKLVIDDLKDEELGLVTVHLYRPFSSKYLLDCLPESVEKIAVLDRTKEFGSTGEPLYLDVCQALNNKDIKIVGGRYGLSGKDTNPAHIYSVYQMLKGNSKNNFTIGITDDVTNLSLESFDYSINLDCMEIKIYGYSSDGMVGASKDIIKIIGENKYVQCYNQYDSKKSNGITISHIRYSSSLFNAPYYITKPNIVVVSKEDYFLSLNMVETLKDNGILIINTKLTSLNSLLTNKDKDYILKHNIKVYTVDANRLALEYNLGGKISKIMEVVILHILGYENAVSLVNDSITRQFKDKEKLVIEENIKAVNNTLNNIHLYNNDFKISDYEEKEEHSIFNILNRMEGNNLKVSEILKYADGALPSINNTTISKNKYVSKWIKENCIKCGICSLVCPHSVIRPFLIKDKTLGIRYDDDYNYIVSILEEKCTSCGLCIKACPALKCALEFGEYDEKLNNKAKEISKQKNPNIVDKYTIKGSQLCEPKFAYSKACMGCGETTIIKLLTQLYGDKLIIANATGCSSIYGGNVGNIPYTIPWANSLFEDNAEFGYGILSSYNYKRKSLEKYIKENINSFNKDVEYLCIKWLNNMDDYEITSNIKRELSLLELPIYLKNNIDYIEAKTVWTIGGDGWAYDIGFGGLDHVLSSNEKVRILVLDTEVYSNTGGQMSKSSPISSVLEFSSSGKKTSKKDLFKIAMNYPNCYVANISLGANYMQAIKSLKEAEENDGPSIVIAYCPCIEHGIKGGLTNAINEQILAVECGYITLMRKKDGILQIDSKEPDFSKYHEFLMNESRYNKIYKRNKEESLKLLELNRSEAEERYRNYKDISEK